MWAIFKVFIESVTMLFLFYVLFCVVLLFEPQGMVGSWLSDKGSYLHPLYWKVKFQLLDHQGNP